MERVVVTWNVAGLDEHRLDERTEAQCLWLLLPEPRPHVIALQEVVRRTWFAHWRPHLQAAGYRVFPADPTTTDSEYFPLLAVRDPAAVAVDVPFAPSRMGRRLLTVASQGWTFSTAHLESERAGGDLRVRQAGAIAAHLAASPGPAVFAGDTNLRVEEEPKIEGLPAIVDVFGALGSPADGRVTWRRGKSGARFDRVWCNRAAQPLRLEVSTRPAELSDHLPVRAVLRSAVSAEGRAGALEPG